MPPSGSLLRRGLRTITSMVRLHPAPFAVAVFGASVFACATVASSYALGRLTDKVIVPRFEDGHVSAGAVATSLALVVLIGIVKSAGIVTRRVFATRAAANIAATLRRRVVDRYQRVPYEYFQRNPTGELLSHAGNDVDASTEVLHPLPYGTGVLVIIVVSVVWLVLTDVWLALVAFVLFPTLVGLNMLYQRSVEAPAEEAQAELGVVSAVAHESFEGALVVKALGAERLESDRFRTSSARLRDAKVKVATTRATFEALLDGLPALGTAVLLPVGAWRIESGAVTVGELVAFVSLFMILIWPLRLIGYVLGELPRAVIGHDRVAAVMAAPEDVRHAIGNGAQSATNHRRGARVDVDALTFGFDGERAVVDEVTFTIESGKTVALVGATGSGKSTLLLLVSGLMPPDGGSVRLDGRDVAGLSVDELRADVAMAFQEPFLFGDTLAENILLGIETGSGGRDLDLDAVATMAGVAGFVHTLPAGYDTVVGERGATLSGGQRQRVALARALARKPRLLLLDDATSAVDPTTEANILAALRTHLTSTTTLVVASRPSTVALADEVLYLDEGRIVDHGTHEELLERQRGYEELVRAYELDRADRGI